MCECMYTNFNWNLKIFIFENTNLFSIYLIEISIILAPALKLLGCPIGHVKT